ncbi:enoyl-CoA hydratase/isomerase family protein [Agromyces bauzanensis]|uniref:enoyl-CoA hydratase n=1 Tax=Agromyces bauzanensis TaxID=1308924 RepID=A0A917PF79_9MICO|nr:enoyl-CoA hydratase-related protein [Agromyces bauzanensis]GGJ73619.1 enoyl-CoA hydratase [Agromyces bauzanensis]
MPEQLVAAETRGTTLVLTLDRPVALNALSRALVDRLADRLEEAAADDAVRAVVLTGSEKAFCAGADIGEIPNMVGASPLDPLPLDRLFETMARLSVPTIAAVRGIAFGGGCELVLACDTAIAGRSASFAVPEVKLGVIPGGGGTQRLVHAIGKAKAMRMLLTGAPVDAEWAYDAGLVADLVDDAQVLGRALELATQIAGNAPRAVAYAADSARRVNDMPLHQGLAHERRNFLLALGTADASEGIDAFTHRRAPAFTGR